MDNSAIAATLGRIADLLEFKEENPFRVRSYRFAADIIADYPEQLAEVARRGGAQALQEIPGVGKAISGKILELVETGGSTFYQELTQEVPESVLELTQVQGIGPKTAHMLFNEFGVTSLATFEAFAEGGGLRLVRGLGDKSRQRILASVKRLRQNQA